MRVVWKDSKANREYKPLKYRGHMVQGSSRGWTTDLPGDDNIYYCHYNALNAIDAALGGTGRDGPASEKRKGYGIKIIGKKTRETG